MAMTLQTDRWAVRAIKYTTFLVVVWLYLGYAGRTRGADPYTDRGVLANCVFAAALPIGMILVVAVPIVGLMSMLEDTLRGKLASIVAISIAGTTVVLSIAYVFPFGLGK